MAYVAIHQPNFLPWKGFFLKIRMCEIFVFLDDVPFSKGSYTNRTRLGDGWLTVPVLTKGRFGQLIRDVEIDNTRIWKKKHLRTIEQLFHNALHFNEIFPMIKEVYEREWQRLMDFNVELIKRICAYLGIERRFVFSSDLNVPGKKEEKVLNIVKACGGDVYISGEGGRKYVDEGAFKREGIYLHFFSLPPSGSILPELMENGKKTLTLTPP